MAKGVGKGNFPRKIGAASPTLRQVFEEMQKRRVPIYDMADRMRRHENRLSEWRRGVVEPGVMAVEEMAQHLGYRLVLIPIESETSVDSGL